jgi:hypothetical protein
MHAAFTVISILVSGRLYVTPSFVPERKVFTSVCAMTGNTAMVAKNSIIFLIILLFRVATGAKPLI